MKKALFLVCLVISVSANAQYFYRDLIIPKRNSEQWAAYKKNSVQKITITSLEADGSQTEGFSGIQNISRDFSTITTITSTLTGGQSVLETNYNAEGRMTRTLDSSEGFSSRTGYSYDQTGKLVEISSEAFADGKPAETEKHRWEYDSEGRPKKMIRIKNETDITSVSFVLDEKGNIAEEHSTRGSSPLPTVYYYYDERNRLTDVVRYSRKAQRLLPDYVFDYDTDGRLTEMLVIPEGSDEYQRWVYQYDASGLKKSERCFDKRRKLLGRIEYNYTK